MLSVTRLLRKNQNGSPNFGDALRYNETARRAESGAAAGSGPVVVWNITRACNLRCLYCYATAGNKPASGELTTREAKELITDLAAFRVPALLFSGGEPLLRPDFFELVAYAAPAGLRPTLSTNGTLITPEIARRLKEAGVSYVGVSLDGVGQNNDALRGRKGAFDAAFQGIRNCLAEGQKVGLRFTITRRNLAELEQIFDFVATEGIARVCFYHLAYAGRGSALIDQDITCPQRRQIMDLIIEKTLDFCRQGKNVEVLTVNNHADGVYLYLRLSRTDRQQALNAYRLLLFNGGNRSGIAIGAIDWEGSVHPDQFTFQHTLGNIRKSKFSEIWQNTGNSLLAGLRNRRQLLKGRCASCRWLEICNGNSRGRAEAVYGDYWAQDPACYLSDEEIY